jgi:hypothetical protein
MARTIGIWAAASMFCGWIEAASTKETPIHVPRSAGLTILSRPDVRSGGSRDLCDILSSGHSRKIARAGCRRQRHSSGACECAGIERLGQRPQRHRQRGQSACAAAANHYSGCAARRIPFGRPPPVAGAARGKDQTNAFCGIQIAPIEVTGGRQAATQVQQRRDSEHLSGMLNSLRFADRAVLTSS